MKEGIIQMAFDDIVKVFELAISTVGLTFVIVGWILPFKQSLKLNKINQSAQLEQIQRELKIKMLDEQISKYYGPISAILTEQSIIRQRIWYQIGRQVIFEIGRASCRERV